MRGYGQKLYQGRVRLDIRKNLLTKRETKLQQAAQEVFQTRMDVALGDVVE